MTNRISMIIPDQAGGVTDYVNLLAPRISNSVRVHRFNSELRVDGESVLLHYSGYGYARHGAPLHLLAWVYRHRPRMKRLGVFFHETHASGRLLSSVFWTSPLQRLVASRLARRSDFWLSNIDVSTRWLAERAGAVPHHCLPVVSNVGETAARPLDRRNIAIVFGSAGLRADTWRVGGEALCRWAKTNQIELHDVGSPIADPDVATLLRTHAVVQHGRLPAEAISALTSAANYGVLSYPSHCVAKSSVFASYCAHGAVPILLTDDPGEYDGLQAGREYLRGFPTAKLTPDALERMSAAAFDWYQPHCIAAHADIIGHLLERDEVPA